MERKYKEKEKTEKDYVKEVEKHSYKTALEARRTLDSIKRTTEKTQMVLSEQREKLEDIRDEADCIKQNVIKGKELSIKMKRAGKLITIGDKISDGIKNLFKTKDSHRRAEVREPQPQSDAYTPSFSPETTYEIKESPKEEDTNDVLLSIRDGLKDLHERLASQNKEINDQVPIIEDITKVNKSATDNAEKVMKNLKKM
ncbi:hypothetical protein NEFER03_1339 [Nematocida sp. LUAm3]|nr:hypothetical protein NEFER03_1339 [Nematocida sp. LUAm3]KAI5174039.1 hypothetical protein NEFER02_0506 [Nematocida sp. LUAm2]KAI5177218.1 hypothetical protein NEFER01_0493 [Nematocida sp. LUAm1]